MKRYPSDDSYTSNKSGHSGYSNEKRVSNCVSLLVSVFGSLWIEEKSRAMLLELGLRLTGVVAEECYRSTPDRKYRLNVKEGRRSRKDRKGAPYQAGLLRSIVGIGARRRFHRQPTDTRTHFSPELPSKSYSSSPSGLLRSFLESQPTFPPLPSECQSFARTRILRLDSSLGTWSSTQPELQIPAPNYASKSCILLASSFPFHVPWYGIAPSGRLWRCSQHTNSETSQGETQ